MKYYTGERMINTEMEYSVIVGGRSNGKSHRIAQHMLDTYLETGKQFVRVVRYLFDISDDFVGNWFDLKIISDLKEKTGKTITFLSPDYYIHNIGESPKTGEIIGTCCALSAEQKYKSNQYDLVANIVIEEFCLLDERNYLEREGEKFLSLLSTLSRSRNPRVWLIGNTISKYNPYFSLLNINIDKLKLKPGMFVKVEQPDLGFPSGPARVYIEYVEMSYEDSEEIPRVLRIGKNDTATTGDYIRADDIIPFEEIGDALPKHILFTIRYENLYYNVRVNDAGFPVYVYRIQFKDKTKNTIVLKWPDYKQTFNHKVDELTTEFRLKWLRTKIYYDDDETKHNCREFLEQI